MTKKKLTKRLTKYARYGSRFRYDLRCALQKMQAEDIADLPKDELWDELRTIFWNGATANSSMPIEEVITDLVDIACTQEDFADLSFKEWKKNNLNPEKHDVPS